MEDQEELPPFLSKMRQKKNQPFSTPPQYFERVQDEVWKKIQAERSNPPLVPISWWQRLVQHFLRPSYGIGLVGMAVVIGVSVFLLQQNEKPKEENFTALLSQISDEELYVYVAENETEFDTETLLENLQESDFENIPTPSEVFADSSVVPAPVVKDTTSSQPIINTNDASPESLLQGISAEDILNFLEEEGIMDDILDEQGVE